MAPALGPFLDQRQSIDGASSVFLLGRKTDTSVSEQDIVSYHQGAQYRS